MMSLFLALTIYSASTFAQVDFLENEELAITEACPSILETTHPLAQSKIALVVWKQEFKLGVYQNGQLVKKPNGEDACIKIALGGDPYGDKRKRGDEKTPEGLFRITHKNPNSSYHLSLGINYPTKAHAELAYNEKRIDLATKNKIVTADKPGKIAYRSSALGGDIFIHGGGDFPDYWTDGCMAMSNENMDWIFKIIAAETPVYIVPNPAND